MNAAVSTAEDRARLAAICRGWIGTPYCGDGAVKGSGVSCSLLPWSILNEYGLDLARPPARADMPRMSVLRFVFEWMNAPHEFAPVPIAEIQPGDIAAVDAGMGHMLLAADASNFIHCWAKGGTQYVSMHQPSIAKRIRGVWRPII